jgi:divalent metal cation (Fe/Co/Zn/Cd) transporter
MARIFVTVETAHFHAIVSAYLSIVAGLVEASLSILAGHAELSMSLYGIALMAFVDITGSLLVLYTWQFSEAKAERKLQDRIREMRMSRGIGIMMIILGLFLIADR